MGTLSIILMYNIAMKNETFGTVGDDTEILADFETGLTSLDDTDLMASRRFVAGTCMTLAERLGVDEAEAWLNEHSVERIARRNMIRRLGSLPMYRRYRR